MSGGKLPAIILMQGLKKYNHLLAQLQAEDEGVTPESLFQLNRSLDIELLLAEREIEHWAKQIMSIQSRIQYLKQQEEQEDESSQWMEIAENDEKAEETRVQHTCSQPNCHRSFPKESTLRCHHWLVHRQELSWQASITIELQQSDPSHP